MKKVHVFDTYDNEMISDRIVMLASNVERAYIDAGVPEGEYSAKDCVDKAIDILNAFMISGAITTSDPEHYGEKFSFEVPENRSYD